MLHITNGDSVVDWLLAAGVPGAMLPWRDVLHEGPVPAGLSLQKLSEVRARFIAEQGRTLLRKCSMTFEFGTTPWSVPWSTYRLPCGSSTTCTTSCSSSNCSTGSPGRTSMGRPSLSSASTGFAPAPPTRGRGAFALPWEVEDGEALLRQEVVLTQTGRDVLAGEAVWIQTTGIDRWLGGVQLHGEDALWRWDARSQQLIGA